MYINFKDKKEPNINKNYDKYLISNLTRDLDKIIKNTSLMGIVLKQTSWNIFTISIAILIGAINTLYFYPEFSRRLLWSCCFPISNIKLIAAINVFWSSAYNNKVFSSFKEKK